MNQFGRSDLLSVQPRFSAGAKDGDWRAEPVESEGNEVLLRALRDMIYELAGSRNRDLAVDVLVHATGVAEYDCRSLRQYAAKHGLSAEGFRKHVLAMQKRLGLPSRPGQHSDAN